jgi:hypothetical protein
MGVKYLIGVVCQAERRERGGEKLEARAGWCLVVKRTSTEQQIVAGFLYLLLSGC